jgi:Glycosyl hydrolase family 12
MINRMRTGISRTVTLTLLVVIFLATASIVVFAYPGLVGSLPGVPTSGSATTTKPAFSNAASTVAQVLPYFRQTPTGCNEGNQSNNFTPSTRALSSPQLGNATLDLWGTQSAIGAVRMCSFPSGGISTNISLSNITYNRIAGPAGYPDISYGASFGPSSKQSSLLSLPESVEALPGSIVAFTNYSVTPSPFPLDFAYDIWLSQTPNAYPWNSGNASNGFEMMVFLYSSVNPTGFLPIGSVSESAVVNGKNTTLNWDEWISQSNGGKWSTISFELVNPIPPGYGSSSDLNGTGFLSADVGVSITSFLSEAQRILNVTTQNYYLNAIDLGSEFGGVGYYACNYTWNLFEYYYVIDGQQVSIAGDY